MKIIKLFLLIIFVIAAIGLAMALVNQEPRVSDNSESPTDNELSPGLNPGKALLGSVFSVPGVAVEVELKEEMVDYGSGDNIGSVIYIKEHATAVSMADKNYIVAPIAANTGGSGTFVYLVLYERQGMVWTQVDEVLLGDRIKVERVTTASAGTVEVIIYDRATDEPFSATPTIERVLQYEIQSNKLEAKDSSV